MTTILRVAIVVLVMTAGFWIVQLVANTCRAPRPLDIVSPPKPALKIVPAPEKTDTNGWPLYELPAEGFALALPPDWVRISADDKSLESVVQSLAADHPGIAAMKDSLRQQIQSGIKLFGFDKEAAKKGRGTNVTVGKFPLPPNATLDEVIDENIGQLKGLFKLGTVKREHRKTQHMEGERLQYPMQIKGPDKRPVDVMLIQYWYASETDFFIVTYTTSPEQAEKDASLAAAICESYRIIDK